MGDKLATQDNDCVLKAMVAVAASDGGLDARETGLIQKVYQDQSYRGYSRMEVSPPNFLDFHRESRSFSGMGAYTPWGANVLGAGD